MTLPYWDALAINASDDDLKEAILAGYLGGKPFAPDESRIAWPKDIHTVLDFGTGIGRNLSMLTSKAQTVLAYDRPAMIARARIMQRMRTDVDWLTTDQARTRVVDLIYASLVLQHIDVVSAYPTFPSHRYLHIYGRSRHDLHHESTFAFLPVSHYVCLEAINYTTGEHTNWHDMAEDNSDTHYEALFLKRQHPL